MRNVFSDNPKLTTLDISGLDLSNVISARTINAFANLPLLTTLKFGAGLKVSMDFSGCTVLTVDSLMSIINNLADVRPVNLETVSGQTLTIGATNKAKLTAEQLQIAIDKGWTVN